VPGGAGGALRSVARDNARLLADAMGVALAGVAIAQEGDRVATALVAPDDGSGRAATLAGVAARHRAGRVVIAAPSAALRWRRVGGLSTAEQLVRRAPCPVVVVPLDGG
jgi:nucleotide-binding universal stress UspA family protein